MIIIVPESKMIFYIVMYSCKIISTYSFSSTRQSIEESCYQHKLQLFTFMGHI